MASALLGLDLFACTNTIVSDLLRRVLPRSGSSLSIGGRGYSCDTLNWSDYCEHDLAFYLRWELIMLLPNKFISSQTCWLTRSTETFMTVVVGLVYSVELLKS